MAYYQGSKLDVINELTSDIDSGLDKMNDDVNFLRSVDWNEIFEHVPNGDSIQSEIEDAINSISAEIDGLKR